jgi:hypothetical protein
MDYAERVIYEGLKQHVTGLFRIYAEFVPGVPFRLLTEDGQALRCEIVEHSLDQVYSDDYIPIYIVFKCGVTYLKLSGYQDSYGGYEWDSFVTEVERKEKVVYLYE